LSLLITFPVRKSILTQLRKKDIPAGAEQNAGYASYAKFHIPEKLEFLIQEILEKHSPQKNE
jgi:hypothetical protein